MMREPEARRRRIVEAAVEVIAEVGVGDATHRRIAAAAGVPLGSTTYYFPTLDDLVREALGLVAADFEQDLVGWKVALQDADDPAATLVDLAEQYLADRPRALLEYELYLAAARTDELRPLARHWLQGLRELLRSTTDAPLADGIAALVDGAILQALVTGEPLDVEALELTLRRLLPPASGAQRTGR
jgi:DNA-binding transcriptional regulator YbjK